MNKKLLTIIGLAIIFSGCSKLKQLTNISTDISYSAQATVPQVPGYTAGTTVPIGGLTLPSVTVGIATGSQTFLAQYNTVAGMVQDVYLKSLTVQILSPSGQNFSFLDSFDIYISGNDLPQVYVASISGAALDADSINLSTNADANLKAYYLQDTIYLTVTARINAVPPTGETLNISTVFHLDANPLD